MRKAGAIATLGDDGTAADFVVLYERHYPRLVRALELAGLGRPAAEDVAQEAFARTLARWWRVRRGSSPAGYVFTVAFRLQRRSWRQREVLVAEPAHSDAWRRASGTLAGDDPVADEATATVDVAAALARMPPGRRACAVLCLVAGMSPHEAGRALGIASSTVRKQLGRARSELESGFRGDVTQMTP